MNAALLAAVSLSLLPGKLSRTIEHVWALVHLPDVRVEEVEQGLLLHLDLANQAYNNVSYCLYRHTHLQQRTHSTHRRGHLNLSK